MMKLKPISILTVVLTTLLLTSCGGGEDDDDNDGGSIPPNDGGNVITGDYRVLAANDLGMHCADRDYQIMSILPPFNNVHAQVIQRGVRPKILSNLEADVFYSATSNPNDPAGANSINTTSQNKPSVFKNNFWKQTSNNKTLAGQSYGVLYPASVFDSFEPLASDVGLPVPDPVVLPGLRAFQQKMPGITDPYSANEPQQFDRYDSTFPFFANFPFGSTVNNVNWFSADGIPMFPVDDQGRSNAYPLMKISARNKAGKELASTHVVLPVASEADCQNCHADPSDAGNGAASSFASVTFNVISEVDAPGPEKLLNAAKINILRLHDTKHGQKYTQADGSAAICDAANNANDPNCLANQTPVQCSQCHYTPALDLAQVGPIDEPAQGIKGRQQKRHISMSRAMHFTHGNYSFNGEPLFPEMPTPNDPKRTSGGVAVNDFERDLLNQTCYQCHPGKQTECLRGAMFTGGVVCQDCHGNMAQVGDDFSEGLVTGAGLDLNKRIPWASEPKCQSCHTGDALTPNHPAGAIVAKDGLRLAQAYLASDSSATPIASIGSRFAENESLYRLSGNKSNGNKGHGGVMCEGCHGSTHAIWPTPNPNSNDNIASKQIQGHTGSIAECTSCHEANSLGNTLGGPHGMHPVGGTRFANGGHERLAESNRNSCRTCHGRNGEGTVLSRVSVDRSFVIEECEGGTLCPGREVDNFRVNLKKGTQVTCAMCHRNEL